MIAKRTCNDKLTDEGHCAQDSLPLRVRTTPKTGVLSQYILQELLIRLINLLHDNPAHNVNPNSKTKIKDTQPMIPMHDVPYGEHGNDAPKLYCAAWLQLLAKTEIVRGPRCLEWGISYTSRWFTHQCIEPYDMRFSEELITGKKQPRQMRASENNGTPGFISAIDDEKLARSCRQIFSTPSSARSSWNTSGTPGWRHSNCTALQLRVERP